MPSLFMVMGLGFGVIFQTDLKMILRIVQVLTLRRIMPLANRAWLTLARACANLVKRDSQLDFPLVGA